MNANLPTRSASNLGSQTLPVKALSLCFRVLLWIKVGWWRAESDLKAPYPCGLGSSWLMSALKCRSASPRWAGVLAGQNVALRRFILDPQVPHDAFDFRGELNRTDPPQLIVVTAERHKAVLEWMPFLFPVLRWTSIFSNSASRNRSFA